MSGCRNCGGTLAGTGERVGANEILKCEGCGATMVAESAGNGSPTEVDPDLRLDEREGAT